MLRRCRTWELTYSSAAFGELLTTYSTHLALPGDRLDRLVACLTELMDERFGGSVVMRYLAELVVARRR